MPESKPKMPHSERERVLQYQVKVLADRLALALVALESYSYWKPAKEMSEDDWTAMRKLLIDSDGNRWRAQFRRSKLHDEALQRVRGWLLKQVNGVKAKLKKAA